MLQESRTESKTEKMLSDLVNRLNNKSLEYFFRDGEWLEGQIVRFQTEAQVRKRLTYLYEAGTDTRIRAATPDMCLLVSFTTSVMKDISMADQFYLNDYIYGKPSENPYGYDELIFGQSVGVLNIPEEYCDQDSTYLMMHPYKTSLQETIYTNEVRTGDPWEHAISPMQESIPFMKFSISQDASKEKAALLYLATAVGNSYMVNPTPSRPISVMIQIPTNPKAPKDPKDPKDPKSKKVKGPRPSAEYLEAERKRLCDVLNKGRFPACYSNLHFVYKYSDDDFDIANEEYLTYPTPGFCCFIIPSTGLKSNTVLSTSYQKQLGTIISGVDPNPKKEYPPSQAYGDRVLVLNVKLQNSRGKGGYELTGNGVKNQPKVKVSFTNNRTDNQEVDYLRLEYVVGSVLPKNNAKWLGYDAILYIYKVINTILETSTSKPHFLMSDETASLQESQVSAQSELSPYHKHQRKLLEQSTHLANHDTLGHSRLSQSQSMEKSTQYRSKHKNNRIVQVLTKVQMKLEKFTNENQLSATVVFNWNTTIYLSVVAMAVTTALEELDLASITKCTVGEVIDADLDKSYFGTGNNKLFHENLKTGESLAITRADIHIDFNDSEEGHVITVFYSRASQLFCPYPSNLVYDLHSFMDYDSRETSWEGIAKKNGIHDSLFHRLFEPGVDPKKYVSNENNASFTQARQTFAKVMEKTGYMSMQYFVSTLVRVSKKEDEDLGLSLHKLLESSAKHSKGVADKLSYHNVQSGRGPKTHTFHIIMGVWRSHLVYDGGSSDKDFKSDDLRLIAQSHD